MTLWLIEVRIINKQSIVKMCRRVYRKTLFLGVDPSIVIDKQCNFLSEACGSVDPICGQRLQSVQVTLMSYKKPDGFRRGIEFI